MTRTLMAVAAVGGLMVSTALAQAPSSPPSSPPAQSSTSSMGGNSMGQPITSQSSNQMLASKLKGSEVRGTDDAKIGDVSDILIDKNGKVDGLVVGVGGFLGIGTKDVALPMSSFQISMNADGRIDHLKLSTTKDQLKEMAEFKPLTSTTTGAASPTGTTRPSPMAPGGGR